MNETTVRFNMLPESDKTRLCEVYGPQPQKGYAAYRIDHVRELTPYEAWFFGRGNFLSPCFLTQTLYKLQGTLLPLRFTHALRKFSLEEDVLRTNYCDMGDRVLAVVTKERKNTETVFYQNLQGHSPEEINATLRKATAALLRYPFNIEKGELLRIVVFHTGKDEYAVLVTAAQIILDRFDIREIIRTAMNMPARPRQVVSPPDFGEQMESKMAEYWKKLLTPPPSRTPLPGELADVPPHPYRQRAYRSVFPAALLSDLRTETKDNRMMMVGALATAWGLFLQIDGRLRDLCCCLVVPKRGKQEESVLNPGFMVPMRQTVDRKETVDSILKRQFQQFLVSQPYACFNWESFGHLLGDEEKPFNYFLDFYDFLSEEKPYTAQAADPEGRIVSQHSWDAQSMKMSLYFRYNGSEAFIAFLYDEDSFTPGTGERIAKTYFLTLKQMLMDRHETFAAFEEHLKSKIRAEKVLQTAYQEEEKARLQHAVSSIRLLQGSDAGTTQVFMQEATLRTYFEGDRVEGMNSELLFVAEGKLARSIEDNEGWYHPLGIAKEGAWLNEAVFLKERKAAISAEVLSERATILAVPKAAMEKILVTYPSLWKNVISYALSQLETYQRLWAQS